MNIRNLLIETMWSFSYKELQSFNKFLSSPYFKKEHVNNSKIQELFKILKLYFSRFPENKRTKLHHLPVINWDKVSEKLFPAISGSEGKKRRLCKLSSELISYILDFFAVESYQNRKVDYRISLSQEILKRNLSSLFEHNWKVKYFSGIYSEDEVTNIYHRYMLIRLANLHKEKIKQNDIDYELELMLFRKYENKTISDLCKWAEENGSKLHIG